MTKSKNIKTQKYSNTKKLQLYGTKIKPLCLEKVNEKNALSENVQPYIQLHEFDDLYSVLKYL